MRKILFFISACLMILPASGLYAKPAEQVIKTKDAYVRATPPGQTVTAAFMKLTNNDKLEHDIVGISSPLARLAQIHQTTEHDGVMKMRHIPVLRLPAHQTQLLQPGGYHIMLMGLKQALKPDEQVPLTLTFKDKSTLELSVPVEKVVAKR